MNAPTHVVLDCLETNEDFQTWYLFKYKKSIGVMLFLVKPHKRIKQTNNLPQAVLLFQCQKNLLLKLQPRSEALEKALSFANIQTEIKKMRSS